MLEVKAQKEKTKVTKAVKGVRRKLKLRQSLNMDVSSGMVTLPNSLYLTTVCILCTRIKS